MSCVCGRTNASHHIMVDPVRWTLWSHIYNIYIYIYIYLGAVQEHDHISGALVSHIGTCAGTYWAVSRVLVCNTNIVVVVSTDCTSSDQPPGMFLLFFLSLL